MARRAPNILEGTKQPIECKEGAKLTARLRATNGVKTAFSCQDSEAEEGAQ